jgi:actin-related protein 5
VTEAMANPEYCRTCLYELMFECYNFPKIFLGVDSLFAAYANSSDLTEYQSRSRLVVNIGYSTIHIVPILKGTVVYNEIKRINVGVGNSWEILHKSLHLKYPHLK